MKTIEDNSCFSTVLSKKINNTFSHSSFFTVNRCLQYLKKFSAAEILLRWKREQLNLKTGVF